MVSISLCMIVKNEEDTLSRCLDSVKDIVDEIIIVDTGSTDKTKDIAKKYGSKIYDFKWIDDFSAARNFSFSKAAKDYIMWLDADDVLLEDDREKLKKLKKDMDPDIDVVMMKYNLGRDVNGQTSVSFMRERIVKREKNYQWKNPVHECMSFDGKILNTNISVTHKKVNSSSGRNLRIYKKMLLKDGKLDLRNTFYYARELYHNKKYNEAIKYYNQFLESEGGLVSNYIDACIDLSKCYTIKNQSKNALQSLIKSFEFSAPCAEICCQIGYYFKEKNDYLKAISWFSVVTHLKKPEISWGSITHDCWGYIPCMELCSCFYRAGNIKEAIYYNNKALEHKPDDPKALHNKEFLNSVVQNINQLK